MAAWGRATRAPFVLGEDAWTGLPNLKRLVDEISARPAALRANARKERCTFKSEMDNEARWYLFPQNVAQIA